MPPEPTKAGLSGLSGAGDAAGTKESDLGWRKSRHPALALLLPAMVRAEIIDGRCPRKQPRSGYGYGAEHASIHPASPLAPV